MKALITGGAGFIGYHLAKKLLSKGYSVVLVDNFSRGVEDQFLNELTKNPNLFLHNLDLMNQEGLDRLGRDFDYVYHLAAIIGVQNVLNRPYDVLQKNIELLLSIIDFARKQDALKRFVFASTSEVYAGTLQHFQMEIPTPEITPLAITDITHPRTSYMLSKIYGEALVHQCGIPFTIIRPHNFYGPRMGMSHVIPELLRKAYFAEENGVLDVFSVNHKRTFCYIDDATEMIFRLVESNLSINETYNVGNEEPEVTIQQVAETILKVVKKTIKIIPQPITPGSPPRRCPAMGKVWKAIQYKGKVSLEQGVENTFFWYKENIFDGNGVTAT